LYANGSIRVRTADGYTRLIPILRGLRQGCPASPIIFDIFIMDLLNGTETFGVLPPGVRDNLIGLLFADDLVLLASTRKDLRRSLRVIQQWAQTNEMSYGVQKCGLMAFPPADNEALLRFRGMELDNQQIPVVDSYRYLGVPIDLQLNMSTIVKDRAKRGLNAFNAVRPVLANKSIPLAIRLNLVTALIRPTLLFAGEVWAIPQAVAIPIQKVMNLVLRTLLGLKPTSNVTAMGTLQLELGIYPMYIYAAAARARAFVKYRGLRTVVARLFELPPRVSRRTWMTKMSGWLSREVSREWATHSADQLRKLTIRKLVHSWKIRKLPPSVRTYLRSAFELTRQYIRVAVFYPDLSVAVNFLTKARVQAIWTATRLATIEYLPPEYVNRCPFCGHAPGETISHMVLECPRWVQSREVHLVPVLNALPDVFRRQSLQQVTCYLLGGSSVRGNSRQLSPFLKRWVGDLQEIRSGNFDFGNRPLFLFVAIYLREVMCVRYGELRPLMEAFRADANDGRAELRLHLDNELLNRVGPEVAMV
jgi:hypothetical protein